MSMIILVSVILIGVIFSSTGGLLWDDTNKNEFRSVIQTPYFVDKSELIQTFFAQRARVILITAPRHFGKTTNMDMLKRFCEMKVFANGSRIPTEDTDNYRIFTGNYTKVQDSEFLDIYKHKDFFNKHFGQYPVIYLDFKSVSANDYENCMNAFKDIVSVAFNTHRYLLSNNSLNVEQVRKLNTFYKKIDKGKLRETDLKNSLKFLSLTLYLHFHKKVVVLIEEYDAPIQNAIFNSGKKVGKTINFIREFISGLLKSNENVKKALLNACVRVSGAATKGANFAFGQKHPFSSYYGFTLDEVKGLAKKFKRSKEMDEIEEWYGGYNVAGNDFKVFNTISIVRYFCSGEFDNYWVQSGCIKNLEKVFFDRKIRKKILTLLKNKTIEIETEGKITIDEVITLSKLISNKEYGMLFLEDIYLFLNFMLDLGYFTTTNIAGKTVTIKIPNKEIKEELHNNLFAVRYSQKKFHLTDKVIRRYINSIKTLGSSKHSFEVFGKCVFKLFMQEDTFPDKKAELQEAMASFPRFYKEFKKVKSEERLKVGETKRVMKWCNKTVTVPRYDVIDILIVRKDDAGIILQLKYYNKAAHRKYSPYAGLEQIINHKYYNIFDSDMYKVRNKIYVGVTIKDNFTQTDVPQCIISGLYNSIDLRENITFTIKE